VNENKMPGNGGTALSQNEYVQELFGILTENGKDTAGLSALLGHVSEMESFVKRAEDKIADMKSQLAEMKEVQNHPVKTALQNAVKTLEHKVAEVKEHLAGLKTSIALGCKNAVDAFKEKGAEALNSLASFFKVRRGMEAVGKSVDRAVGQCDKAVAAIDKFASEYHSGTRALKNMGRILIGKDPLDAKKENGMFAKSMSAPYKVEKVALLGIKNAADKVIAAVAGMEERQAARLAERPKEKKPSLLGKLAEAKQAAAELNRASASRERAAAKGAEL
jgi:cytochrome b involved in lipid metabolism